MINLNIKDDLKHLDRKLKGLEKSIKNKAVPQAINKTIVAVKGHASKAIAQTTGYKQKDIRATIVARKASKGSYDASLDAVAGKAENLIKFVRPAQQNPQVFRRRTRKGFKYSGVKAKAWGAAREYAGTFIGHSKSGNAKVYKRTGASRGKITQVSGPSIRREFINDQLTASMRQIARLRFRKELTAAVNNQIRKVSR